MSFIIRPAKKFGKQTADAWYFQLRNSELNVVNKEELISAAGLEKCRHPHTLSLADCFALALARAEKALLVTTDGELAKVREVKTRHIEV